jgi:hypothetical protein
LQHYNHLASEQTAAKRKQYQDWVHSHTPEEIRVANVARARLRALLPKLKSGRTPAHTHKIIDDRAIKLPLNQYARFATERFTTGDFKGISQAEASKLISNEWKALSTSEKQVRLA